MLVMFGHWEAEKLNDLYAYVMTIRVFSWSFVYGLFSNDCILAYSCHWWANLSLFLWCEQFFRTLGHRYVNYDTCKWLKRGLSLAIKVNDSFCLNCVVMKIYTFYMPSIIKGTWIPFWYLQTDTNANTFVPAQSDEQFPIRLPNSTLVCRGIKMNGILGDAPHTLQNHCMFIRMFFAAWHTHKYHGICFTWYMQGCFSLIHICICALTNNPQPTRQKGATPYFQIDNPQCVVPQTAYPHTYTHTHPTNTHIDIKHAYDDWIE